MSVSVFQTMMSIIEIKNDDILECVESLSFANEIPYILEQTADRFIPFFDF